MVFIKKSAKINAKKGVNLLGFMLLISKLVNRNSLNYCVVVNINF